MAEWNLDEPLTPERLAADERLRKRARRKLEANRRKLPRLTSKQAETIVDLMIDAYRAGEQDTEFVVCQTLSDKARERSRRGVLSRRKKSRRMEIAAAFQAAASARKDVSVEELAKQFGVSRATAYRALAMRPTSRPKR
jgi:hypothetical protein